MPILNDGTGVATSALTGAGTVAAPIPPGPASAAYVASHGGGWFGVYRDGRQVEVVQGRDRAEQLAADLNDG